LAGARPGSGNFAFTVHGRSAHAGRNPEEGRNAIIAAADLALRLKAAMGPGLKVNPAKIDGGSPTMSCPTRRAAVNPRPETLEDQARAQALIDSTIADIAAEHDVNPLPRPFRPSAQADDARGRGAVQPGYRPARLGQSIGWRSTGGVCDGNTSRLRRARDRHDGCAAEVSYSMEEFLIVDSLAERAALSALTVLRLAEPGVSCRIRAARSTTLAPYDLAS
jgi:glutamate carboxypeptidase